MHVAPASKNKHPQAFSSITDKMTSPRCILLISGKRKSGKDFISERLKSTLSDENCCIVRISEPIKNYYAEKNNLNLDQLMSDGPYKEEHRQKMIEWSDGVRAVKPGYFCAAACEKAPAKTVWIVSDIRRKTDIKWFQNVYSDRIYTVRINAEENVRADRGWSFTSAVDDVPSECDLDDYDSWDLLINNNNDDGVQEAINSLIKLVHAV